MKERERESNRANEIFPFTVQHTFVMRGARKPLSFENECGLLLRMFSQLVCFEKTEIFVFRYYMSTNVLLLFLFIFK